MQKKERKQIYYVGFYSNEYKAKIKRYSVPAAVNKMNYLAKIFVRLGCDIQIVSPSWITSKGKHLKYYASKTKLNSDRIPIVHTPSFISTNRVILFLSRFFVLSWLFFFLIKNTRKETIVILYHSTLLYFPILFAKRIRLFKLILEVEEIYHFFTKTKKLKEDAMLSLADSYLLSNKRINKYLATKNDRKKPFVVINGEYRPSCSPKTQSNNKLIKVVYAGQIDLIRLGAFNAVSCSKHLAKEYRLYILGFGKDCDRIKLEKEIEKVNKSFGYKKCIYLGVKYGEDYDQFLSSCDIAINPQEANESYMQFAFPSKVISYLCHNLRTVSTELQAIVDSEFADLVTFVPNPTPQNFAKAIMSININEPFYALRRIKTADSTLINNLKQLVF